MADVTEGLGGEEIGLALSLVLFNSPHRIISGDVSSDLEDVVTSIAVGTPLEG